MAARDQVAFPLRAFDRLSAALNVAGAVWMFAIMFLVLADVFGRNLLGQPISAVPELVAYSFAGSVFLQMPNTLLTGRFVRAEILIANLEKRRPGLAALFNTLFNLAGTVLFAVVLQQILPQLAEDLANPERNSTGVQGVFRIPDWPLTMIITLGIGLTLLAYALRTGQNALQLWTQRTGPAGFRPGWQVALALAVLVGLAAIGTQMEFGKTGIGALSFVAMIVVVMAGMDIGIGLIGISLVAIWAMMGSPMIGTKILKLSFGSYLQDYFFAVVPLFVLMGLVLKETAIAADMFQVARQMLRHVKGGLGVATVAANAVFAAVTGSSIASAAVFSKIATPELLRHGYSPRFSVGVVAGSSVLGMLIPPSLLLIVYGFVAQVSVGVLFIAAILPGLLLALAMSLTIVGLAYFWPSYIGSPDDTPVEETGQGSAWLKLAPMSILVTAVIGGIYGGFTTPVEAGAIGASGAILIALAMRRLTWPKLYAALLETGHVTVSILFLILAANVFSRMLAISGLPQAMTGLLSDTGLGFYGFLALYVLAIIFLGMFLESVSLMLIVVPFVLPLVEGFGGDLVWFGLVTVVAVEMGLLTPPMGIACYVVRSTINDPRIRVQDVFAGSLPFTMIMFVVTIVLILVPGITLLLV
jgi:tripartite ATP-independent transporter DctM subunit